MATVYLIQNMSPSVTFSNSSINDGSRLKWSTGSQSTSSCYYTCTYNCPSGSTVAGSANKGSCSGTVADAKFICGSYEKAISSSTTSYSTSASGSKTIGYYLYVNGWESGGATVRVQNCNIYVSYTSTYTVTVQAGTGISSVSGGGTVNEGSSKTINATVQTGYKWYRWTYTSGGSQFTTTQNYTISNIKQNYNLTANAQPITYTIAYNGNGNTGGSMSNTTNCSYASYVTLRTNAFTKDKYIFKGWNTSQTAANAGTVQYTDGHSVINLSSTQGATVTLYAVWELDPNQVFVNSTRVYANGWK